MDAGQLYIQPTEGTGASPGLFMLLQGPASGFRLLGRARFAHGACDQERLTMVRPPTAKEDQEACRCESLSRVEVRAHNASDCSRGRERASKPSSSAASLKDLALQLSSSSIFAIV